MKLKIWFALNRVRVIAATIGVVAITGGLGTAAIINRAAGGVTLEPGPELDAAIEEAESSLDNDYRQNVNGGPTDENVANSTPPNPANDPKVSAGTLAEDAKRAADPDYIPRDENGAVINPNAPYKSSASQDAPAASEDVYTYYTTLWDFERAALGMCPQDVPSHWWSQPPMPSVSIGIVSSFATPGQITLKEHTVWVWNLYKSGQIPSTDEYQGGSAKEFDPSITYKDAKFTVNWASLTVYFTGWGYQEMNNVSTTDKAKMDAMAAEATTYMRWLDSTYNAKCGSYPKMSWSYEWLVG